MTVWLAGVAVLYSSPAYLTRSTLPIVSPYRHQEGLDLRLVAAYLGNVLRCQAAVLIVDLGGANCRGGVVQSYDGNAAGVNALAAFLCVIREGIRLVRCNWLHTVVCAALAEAVVHAGLPVFPGRIAGLDGYSAEGEE